MVRKTKTTTAKKEAPWAVQATPVGIALRLGFGDRVNARDAMARVLAAGEALREAASAYDAALSAMPQGVVGYALGVEVDEVLERLTGAVSAKVTPALHELERAIYAARQAENAKGNRP